MLRLIALGVAFLLTGLMASVSSLVADEQPVPPADPKSQEECRTYRRQQIDYARIALQKSRECSARNSARQNEDMVLYQPSCGGTVLSAFRACKDLSDAAWCALADESAKMRTCVEKASAAEQKPATDVLARSEMPFKIESEKLLQEQHAAAEISEALHKFPQQEQDRARSLEQDQAAARRDGETQTAFAAKTLDDASLAKQAADLTAVHLRQSLKEERERAGRLEALVAGAQPDVETQTALAAKATDEASRLKQAAEQSSATLKLSLQKERERADALSNDLSMARAAIYAYEAQASKASDHATNSQQSAEDGAAALRTSLQQEQERAVRLEQDLAATRREVESWTAKANAEAARLKQADDNGAQSLRLLQQEREKSARLERELASERKTAKEALARSGDMTTTRGAHDRPPAADAITGAGADQPTVPVARRNAKPEPENAAEVTRLMARASGLLGRGDIGSARVVLERAAETGDAQASFALAETYDPVVLRKWGAYGTLGDAAKARELYARAQAGGIKEAMESFDPLHRRFVGSGSDRIGDPQKGAGQ